MNRPTATAEPRTIDLNETDPNAQTHMEPYRQAGPIDVIPNREEWEHLMGVSENILKAGFANQGLNTKEKVALAILKGREVGLPSLMAVQEIGVVHNKTFMSAVALRALLERKGCRVRDIIYSETESEVEITRPDGRTSKLKFTIQDAQRMRAKEGDDWKPLSQTARYRENPALMLNNRALSRLARRFCPDIVFGLGVDDEAADEGRVVDVSPPAPEPVRPDVEQPQASDATPEAQPSAESADRARMLRERLQQAQGEAPPQKKGF